MRVLVLGFVAVLSACGDVNTDPTPAGARPLDRAEREMAELRQRVAELEAIVEGLSRDDDGDLVLSGANLRIVNGTGTTVGENNGVGNLIIGYDEEHEDPWSRNAGGVKLASHSLILGPHHSYRTVGSVVAGAHHTVFGENSAAVGGSHHYLRIGDSDKGSGLAAFGGTNASITADHGTAVGVDQGGVNARFAVKIGGYGGNIWAPGAISIGSQRANIYDPAVNSISIGTHGGGMWAADSITLGARNTTTTRDGGIVIGGHNSWDRDADVIIDHHRDASVDP